MTKHTNKRRIVAATKRSVASKPHAWLGSECRRCAMRAGWAGASRPCRGPLYAAADLPSEAPLVPAVTHGLDLEPGSFRLGRS